MAEKELWIDEVFDNLRLLDGMAWDLFWLSNSLDRVGNHEIAAELREYSEQMKRSNKAISGAISQNLHEGVEAGQKEMANLLKVALGGTNNG